MRTTGAREVEVMVVGADRWTTPRTPGTGTPTRLCGGSLAAASVELPWVVSSASVAQAEAPGDGTVAAAAAVASPRRWTSPSARAHSAWSDAAATGTD